MTVKNFSRDDGSVPNKLCQTISTQCCCIHVYGNLRGQESLVLHPMTEGPWPSAAGVGSQKVPRAGNGFLSVCGYG